jgi:hypothetical protein
MVKSIIFSRENNKMDKIMDKTYITEYEVYNEGVTYCYEGPRIKAENIEEARIIAEFKYSSTYDVRLRVIGELLMEFEPFNLN